MNIKETWQQIKVWWDQLAVREKRAIVIGGSLLGIFILYKGIWMPSLQHLDNMRQSITSGQKTLAFMQSADQLMQVNAEHSKQKPVSLVVFLSQMQKQIKLAGLEPYLVQLKQAAEESVEMHFQKVEFDRLVTFLIATTKEYPVTILQLSVIALDTQGYVNADILLAMQG
jgi:type II secretory pathway component PulM